MTNEEQDEVDTPANNGLLFNGIKGKRKNFNNIIVGSQVRAIATTHEMKLSPKYVANLEAYVRAFIVESVRTAKVNKRRTLLAEDCPSFR